MFPLSGPHTHTPSCLLELAPGSFCTNHANITCPALSPPLSQ